MSLPFHPIWHYLIPTTYQRSYRCKWNISKTRLVLSSSGHHFSVWITQRKYLLHGHLLIFHTSLPKPAPSREKKIFQALIYFFLWLIDIARTWSRFCCPLTLLFTDFAGCWLCYWLTLLFIDFAVHWLSCSLGIVAYWSLTESSISDSLHRTHMWKLSEAVT